MGGATAIGGSGAAFVLGDDIGIISGFIEAGIVIVIGGAIVVVDGGDVAIAIVGGEDAGSAAIAAGDVD